MASLFTKEEVFAQKERVATETFSVPGLEEGKEIRIRKWPGNVRDEWELFCFSLSDGGKTDPSPEGSLEGQKRILVYSIVQPDGMQMFSLEDIPALNQLPADALDYILERAAKLNGLENVKERAKNSAATTGDDSSSD